MITMDATLTRHAQMRRKQMGVTEHRIQTVLADPETTYPGDSHHPGERTCYHRGDLVVVVNNRNNLVLTVLWYGKTKR